MHRTAAALLLLLFQISETIEVRVTTGEAPVAPPAPAEMRRRTHANTSGYARTRVVVR